MSEAMREKFEKWYESEYDRKLIRSNIDGDNYFKDSYTCMFADKAWKGWQAAASHYEQEIQSLLALVALKDEALSKVCTPIIKVSELLAAREFAKPIYALQPDSCRLVVIGNISGNDVFLHSDLKGVECCIYRIETIKDSGEQHE
jgi:hypothetical protein